MCSVLGQPCLMFILRYKALDATVMHFCFQCSVTLLKLYLGCYNLLLHCIYQIFKSYSELRPLQPYAHVETDLCSQCSGIAL